MISCKLSSVKSCGLASYLNFTYMHNKNAKALLEAFFFSFTVQSHSLAKPKSAKLSPLDVVLIVPCNEPT